MKHDCELIQELLPLYEDGVLQHSVSKKIEQHLKTCDNCQKHAAAGEGLHDYLEAQQETAPTAELDHKMNLRFKLRRMKMITGLLIAVIATSLIQDYVDSRERMIDGMNDLYRSAEFFEEMTDAVIREEKLDLSFYNNMYFDDHQAVNKLEDHYNWVERTWSSNSYHALNSESYFHMIEVMNYRHYNGMWDENDKKAYAEMKANSKGFLSLIKKEDQAFRHGYSSYFELLDIKDINAYYKKMNELSYFYITYHKVPDEMNALSESEMKKRLKSFFRMKKAEVSLEKRRVSSSSDLPGDYRYTIKKGDQEYTGEMNAYSGYIFSAHLHEDSLSGKPKSPEELFPVAKEYAKRLFGEENNVKIKYEGKNFNYFSAIDVQSYSVTPVFLAYEGGQSVYIHLNARSGELTSLMGDIMKGYIPVDKEINSKVTISKEKAEKTAINIIEEQRRTEPVKLSFVETKTILSMLTGRYTVVHRYDGENDETVYINAKTGEQEIPYTGSH